MGVNTYIPYSKGKKTFFTYETKTMYVGIYNIMMASAFKSEQAKTFLFGGGRSLLIC